MNTEQIVCASQAFLDRMVSSKHTWLIILFINKHQKLQI